jgi:hypothetical protein
MNINIKSIINTSILDTEVYSDLPGVQQTTVILLT